MSQKYICDNHNTILLFRCYKHYQNSYLVFCSTKFGLKRVPSSRKFSKSNCCYECNRIRDVSTHCCGGDDNCYTANVTKCGKEQYCHW